MSSSHSAMIGISHSTFIPTPTHSSPKSADEEIVARSKSFCPLFSLLAARKGGTRRLEFLFFFTPLLQIAFSRLLLPSSSSSSRETPEKDASPEYTFKAFSRKRRGFEDVLFALFVARKEDEKDKACPSCRRLFENEEVLVLPFTALFDDGDFCASIRMEILKIHIATFRARTRDLRETYILR